MYDFLALQIGHTGSGMFCPVFLGATSTNVLMKHAHYCLTSTTVLINSIDPSFASPAAIDFHMKEIPTDNQKKKIHSSSAASPLLLVDSFTITIYLILSSPI
jgi:hypothetical protein